LANRLQIPLVLDLAKITLGWVGGGRIRTGDRGAALIAKPHVQWRFRIGSEGSYDLAVKVPSRVTEHRHDDDQAEEQRD
jgi:hypothetical protein